MDNVALDKLYNYEFWHYRQGIGAYIIGLELDESPHQLGTREHAEWRRGFCSKPTIRTTRSSKDVAFGETATPLAQPRDERIATFPRPRCP